MEFSEKNKKPKTKICLITKKENKLKTEYKYMKSNPESTTV